MPYPVTPDDRYFVVKGRLWRCTGPVLSGDLKERLVADLMRARRQKATAMRSNDSEKVEAARQAIDVAKEKLGEEGVFGGRTGLLTNRFLVKNTPMLIGLANWRVNDSRGLLWREDGVAPELCVLFAGGSLAPLRFLDHRKQGMVSGVGLGDSWKYRLVYLRL
jgi:hypothetical protein